MKDSPIFLKSFETLEWILTHTSKFPKHQRFVMAKRIEDAALAFHDNLLWAAKVRWAGLSAVKPNAGMRYTYASLRQHCGCLWGCTTST